jgi:hypothetical protein
MVVVGAEAMGGFLDRLGDTGAIVGGPLFGEDPPSRRRSGAVRSGRVSRVTAVVSFALLLPAAGAGCGLETGPLAGVSASEAGADSADSGVDAGDAGLPGRCDTDLDCDDGVSCTWDRCAGGRCDSIADDLLCELGQACDAVSGCQPRPCGTDGECDDEQSCTVDRCDLDAGTCRVEDDFVDGDGDGQIGTACGGDDCDDSNAAIHPAVEDATDADGIDANCDGIDGDVERAVFVAPAGVDTGAGTPDDPLATVGAGVALARDLGFAIVVIAEGRYAGVALVTVPLSLEGGFSPGADGWRRNPGARSEIVGEGTAISIEDVDGMVVLRSLRVDSGAPSSTGASTYGVRAVRSSNVLLEDIDVVAAAGADGSAGVPGSPGAVMRNWTSIAGGDLARASYGYTPPRQPPRTAR